MSNVTPVMANLEVVLHDTLPDVAGELAIQEAAASGV
jgi:hypothetical protein